MKYIIDFGQSRTEEHNGRLIKICRYVMCDDECTPKVIGESDSLQELLDEFNLTRSHVFNFGSFVVRKDIA